MTGRKKKLRGLKLPKKKGSRKTVNFQLKLQRQQQQQKHVPCPLF